MTEEAGFWQAIESAPADPLPLLVFADWLEEHGDDLASTLRACAEDGRRPGVKPNGRAFWVTTSEKPLSAYQPRRSGRGQPSTPFVWVRQQPSWLAGVFFRELGGFSYPWPLMNYGTVHEHLSVQDAWRALHHARGVLESRFFNPDTGRNKFAGLTNSHWRDRALQVIATTMKGIPADADGKAVRKALRDAYPFGKRSGHPYKMWCEEQARVLAKYYTPVNLAEPGALCKWCRGRGCVACFESREQNSLYAGSRS